MLRISLLFFNFWPKFSPPIPRSQKPTLHPPHFSVERRRVKEHRFCLFELLQVSAYRDRPNPKAHRFIGYSLVMWRYIKAPFVSALSFAWISFKRFLNPANRVSRTIHISQFRSKVYGGKIQNDRVYMYFKVESMTVLQLATQGRL